MNGTAQAAEVLTTTLTELSTAASLEDVTRLVASAVRELMGSHGATFVLREDDKCFYVDENAIGPMWKGQRFPLTACISGWAMLNKQVVKISDIYQDDRIPHDAYRPTFVKSLTMAPIRATDPIGALGAYWKQEHTPSDEEVRLLEVLANSASVALENLELREALTRRVAERDHLASRKNELENAIHSIAHDLKNPLGAIMGYAELLSDGLASNTESAEVFAKTITETGQRMSAQIDRMLALYRITTRPLSPELLDLTEMGRDLTTSLLQQVGNRDLDVSIQEGLRATADPVLTRLLMENLISNAIKYTGKKSAATVEVGRIDDDHGFTTFYVRDNGDGFDPADSAKLFRPMTRLHTQTEFPGTGLGLASVARIVELHGGEIRAEGKKSEGAVFYFTLPTAA